MAETRGFFTQLIAYHSSPETMGSVWGPQALMLKFPHFVLCDDPSMTTDALCKEVRQDRIKGQTKQLLKMVEDVVSTDPMRAVSMLQETSAILRNDCTPKKIDVHMADGLNRVWEGYCAAERGEVIAPYSWPWEPLQRATLGVRPTDYIILYGRPKSMKSWVLCFIIAHIIYSDVSKRILIYSKEMDADEIFERIGCLLACVQYENFTGGTMNPEEKARFAQCTQLISSLRSNMTVVCLSAQDVKQGQDTVNWLESKIERYAPHAVFIDGLYLMSDAHGAKKLNERVANISKAVRQLALHNRIPIIATVQANRDAAKNEDANTEEVAFSDSLGQDATMLIRVINEWKKGSNTLALVMGGASRRYKLSGFRINGMPAVNFSYYGELSDKEAQSVLKKEGEQEQKQSIPVRRPITKKSASDLEKEAANLARSQ